MDSSGQGPMMPPKQNSKKIDLNQPLGIIGESEEEEI